MENPEVAQVFDEVADLLEIQATLFFEEDTNGQAPRNTSQRAKTPREAARVARQTTLALRVPVGGLRGHRDGRLDERTQAEHLGTRTAIPARVLPG